MFDFLTRWFRLNPGPLDEPRSTIDLDDPEFLESIDELFREQGHELTLVVPEPRTPEEKAWRQADTATGTGGTPIWDALEPPNHYIPAP